MATVEGHAGLVSGFLASAAESPGRPAIEIAGDVVSYEDLRLRAEAIAAALLRNAPSEPPLTGVFGSRSPSAYAGVLGALLRGHGYVPLQPRFPADRNRSILERSGCAAVVVDGDSVERAVEVLAGLGRRLVVVLPDREPSRSVGERLAPHEVVGVAGGDAPRPEPRPSDPAYLLFTSGSTGRPKGVLVRQANVRAFLDAVSRRYDLDPDDKLSQLFDLTFDLSVFDLFAAWEHGACVCSSGPGELASMNPSSLVRSAGLTVWFSVPSVAMFLQRFHALRRGAFPSLRLSLFCGEALPASLASAWAGAAPGSVVDNLYGPTEATIACTVHRFELTEERDPSGLVPIGSPLGPTRVQVVDEALREVTPGEEGQLAVGGPQVVEGYLDDEQATASAFVSLPELGPAYLTGDRVRTRPSDGELVFLGRLDTQIKVLGYRVELEEIEAVIREEAGLDAIAVGWPRTETGAAGIVAVVAGRNVDPVKLRERLSTRLPDYMLPRQVHVLPELPLNANGKRDRRAVAEILENA
jgi:amino acid adenylation domain-containing protein